MCSLVHKIALLLIVVVCDGTRIIFKYDDIVSKTKVELKPVHIQSGLNEMLVLTTPIVNCKHAKYQLRKPNGDILRTKSAPKQSSFNIFSKFDPDDGRVIVKYINKQVKAMYPKQMYKIFDLTNDYDEYSHLDATDDAESRMNKNDFIVGPLQEEDHGNWALSVYCKDIDDEWVEMFQVITVEIISYVEMTESEVKLPEGSIFNISFLYPIKDLETCELNAPKSVSDRFYDRSRIDLERCGYVVQDIRRSDQGRWRVVAVGRIVYEGVVTLTIVDDNK